MGSLDRSLPYDEPHITCNCFRIPHAFYCATWDTDLVPGYWDTQDGKLDAADQARWDAHTAAAVEKILGA